MYAVAVNGMPVTFTSPQKTFGFLKFMGLTYQFAEKIALETVVMTGSNDAFSLLAMDADDMADRLALPRIQKMQLEKAITALKRGVKTGQTLEEIVRVWTERLQNEELRQTENLDTDEVDDKSMCAYGVLRGSGYTHDFAMKIAFKTAILTGRDDGESLLTVDADMLADELHFVGFQRRRLKKILTYLQEANRAGKTPAQALRAAALVREADHLSRARVERIEAEETARAERIEARETARAEALTQHFARDRAEMKDAMQRAAVRREYDDVPTWMRAAREEPYAVAAEILSTRRHQNTTQRDPATEWRG
jgi:hypothetical protein